jgi:hypothetical protein
MFTDACTLEVLMNTRYLVDPGIAPVLDQFPALQLTPETLPQIRAMMVEMSSPGGNTLPSAGA